MAAVPSDSYCKYIMHPSFFEILNLILKFFKFHSHMMLELKDPESFTETSKTPRRCSNAMVTLAVDYE